MKYLLTLLILACTWAQAQTPIQALNFRDVTRWGSWRGEIASYELQVSVEGLVSRNVLTMEFQDFESNQGDSLEMTYSFALPKGSVVDSLYLWVGEEKVPAALKSIWTAWQIYGSIVRQRQDPALLTTSGNDNYNLRVFPFARRQARRVEICYTTPLTAVFDRLRMEVPLQLTLPSAKAVGRIRANVRISGIGKDRIAVSSTLPVGWEKTESGADTRLAFKGDGRTFREAAYIHLDHPDYAQDGMAVHFDVDAKGETHFMALLNPRKALGLPATNKKRKLLVLWNLVTAYPKSTWNGQSTVYSGVSKSYYYNAQFLQEGKEIADFLQSNLSPGDEVNLMFNDLQIKPLSPGFIHVDENTISELRAFIDQRLDRNYRNDIADVMGGADLLAQGLRSLEGTENAELLVIDRHSQSYWWDTTYADGVDSKALLAMAPEGLTAYVVAQTGAGSINSKPTNLANAYQGLARETGGTLMSGGYQYYPIAPVLEGLRPFFSERIYPASLSFSAGATGFAYDVFGAPSMFYMDQNVVVTGKLSLPASLPFLGAAPQALTVRFLGKAEGKDVALTKDFAVTRTTAASRLSRIWGARKVESILGAGYYSPRLWEEATDWSLEYRILTPVTALLALEPGRFDSTWYQDQQPNNNPNLPTGLGGDTDKRLAPGALALTQEPGFLLLDLSGFEPGRAGRDFSLQIFDARGRMVADLTAEASKGGKALRWSTGTLSKGAYVLKLRAGGKVLARGFTLR